MNKREFLACSVLQWSHLCIWDSGTVVSTVLILYHLCCILYRLCNLLLCCTDYVVLCCACCVWAAPRCGGRVPIARLTL